MSISRLGVAVFLIFISSSLLKFADANYDDVKYEYGTFAPLLFLIVGVILLVSGIVFLVKSFRSAN